MLLLTLSVAMLAGCRETPEESAVASRAGGLPENAVIEPLADGETQIIELPDKWQQTEKWSKDRWIWTAGSLRRMWILNPLRRETCR